ncbi:ABC transporter substrate-binding protein [Glutamicibacter protophormiae]|uniref:ABC transporter substrate-binding protein n=1 Tax=Glutamicibacter protophormiae TaxID=37930 RepID=UPI002A828FB3|nr:ABC transporter substrate-binding protein [Glutamicibacter protophormiae]WPR63084.1 ABC transporter substrate-binding protein [Glutamicibacter protophormiae]WPR66581.1 ABC transporter substrate-binding protein [Glutamicibacter protophormiae]
MQNNPLASTLNKSSSRRSFLGALGLTALAIPALAACGNSSAGAFSQPATKVPAGFSGRRNVVIWSSWGGDNGKMFADLIKKFNESQTAIYAEVQQFDGYDGVGEKLTAGLRAKQIPDLAVLSDIHWNRYFLSDALEPLNKYHDSGFGPAVYTENFYKEGTVRDESYWVPFARSTPLFYYNRDLFASVGLPDRAPDTWDEFRSWGKEITGVKFKGNTMKMRALTGTDDWYFSGLLWAFGGSISKGLDVTLDSAESMAAVDFERQLVHEDKSMYLAQSFVNDFSNGQCATVTQSTGGLTSVTKAAKFDVGTGFMPKGPAGAGTPTGGGGLSVMRQISDERKAGAVEVLRFLASDEISAQWTVGTGYLPVTKGATSSKLVTDLMGKNPNYRVAVDQLQIASGPDDVRRYVTSAISELKQMVQKNYTSNVSPEELVKPVAEKLRTEAEKIRSTYEEKVA